MTNLVKFAVGCLPFIVFAYAVEHNYPDRALWWVAFTVAIIARDLVNDG